MESSAKISNHASLLCSPADINQLKYKSHALMSLTLTPRQRCDLELLLNGGFAPLKTFMCKADYESVLAEMRLSDGQLWPMPITLDVDANDYETYQLNQEIALRDDEGILLAILQIEDKWKVDKQKEAMSVFGTLDLKHPGVAFLFKEVKDYYIGGQLIGVSLPQHYDFINLRKTPHELKTYFRDHQFQKVVGFQTRNPMHRAHHELTLLAAEKLNANILVHPVVGLTKPGDIEYFTRVRCYQHIINKYPPNTAVLSLLPLAMRMAGPKEALWHALIRKNYGCTHFIIGRDHAGPGKNSLGKPFYDPYAAQMLAQQYQSELEIEIVSFPEMVYSKNHNKYFSIKAFPENEQPLSISGTQLRSALQTDQEIPEWFSYPEVIAELRKTHPPRSKQGFTLFLTGLPSSGKSTLANGLALQLRELTDRKISILDGDIIRLHLSKGLGFSREDRETNITRVGFVAKEITKHGGVAICALVSPYLSARDEVRQMIDSVGGFIEIYVATPLAECEKRDRKGLYKKAREGVIKQFTGISDVYEAPTNAEIVVDTTGKASYEVIEIILNTLNKLGYF